MSSGIAALPVCALGVRRADRRSRRTTPTTDGIRALLQRLEQIVQAGDAEAYLGTVVGDGRPERRRAISRDSSSRPGATRVVVQERDREPLAGTLPGNGYRLTVDVVHRVRRPRAHRDVAARRQAGRRRQRRGLADRRPGAVRAGREPVPALAQPDEAVRRARPHDRGRRSRADARRGLGLRRRHRPRARPGWCCSAAARCGFIRRRTPRRGR